MTGTKDDFIKYRLNRAKETYEDALILSERKKWNSTINRLYYSAYYAVIALLLAEGFGSSTHNGVKTKFSQQSILTGKIDSKYGKMYSQLFTWRQKGDYDDLFDFDEEKVIPYFQPVKEFIEFIETMVKTDGKA